MPALVKHDGNALGSVLYAHIKKQIQQARLKPGDRLQPSRALQKSFRLSHGATLAALRRLQKEGFVVCRPGAGTYVSEATAGVRGKPNAKAVQVISSTGPARALFYRPLIDALCEQLDALGADLTIQHDPERSASWDEVSASEADVRIWIRPKISAVPRSIALGKMPCVLISEDIDLRTPARSGYDVVTADSEQGGSLAADYLRSIGCRSVALLAVRSEQRPDRPGPIGSRRVRGFENAWGELIDGPLLLTDRAHAEQGAAQAREFLSLKDRPEAVFAICDPIASGFCHGLMAHGVRPGKDVKVMGFSAQPPFYEDDPPLTSVLSPMEDMGRAGAVFALERADEPRKASRRLQIAYGLRQGVTA